MRLFLSILLCMGLKCVAQNVDLQCANSKLLQLNPELNEAFQTYYGDLTNQANLRLNKTTLELPSEINIQVVFHVLFSNPQENVHDSFIQDQLNILNDAFYFCTDTVRELFSPVKACPKISFVLAKQDPNGNPTNGIIRKKTTRTTFNYGDSIFVTDDPKFGVLGGADAWDTRHFLNIWICNLSPAKSGVTSVAGYAFPPTNGFGWHKSLFVADNRQGIVVHFSEIGRNNPNSKNLFPLGSKVLVHELGHYFGLKHVWGDEAGTCDVSMDDGLDDTPLCARPSFGCNFDLNSCTEGQSGDKPDMVENFMNYSKEVCASMFTQQQTRLMVLNLLFIRNQLFKPAYTGYDTRFFLFPNPCRNALNYFVKTKVDPSGTNVFRIVSLLGEVVVEKTLHADITSENIDISMLTAGVYFAQVIGVDKTLTVKFIKQ